MNSEIRIYFSALILEISKFLTKEVRIFFKLISKRIVLILQIN